MEEQAAYRAFTFFPSYFDACRDLPDEDRLAVYDAILFYGVSGKMPEIDKPLVRVILELVSPTIDKSARTIESRRENGRVGGRPRKTEPEPKETEPEPKETEKPPMIHFFD